MTPVQAREYCANVPAVSGHDFSRAVSKSKNLALAAQGMFFGSSPLLQQGEERFSAPKNHRLKGCALALGIVSGDRAASDVVACCA